MPDMRRLPLLAAAVSTAALALSGCITPHSTAQVSQAVLDARAHRDVEVEPDCATIPLSSVSPVFVGFAFEESDLTALTTPTLEKPARWLACHPGVPAVIKPSADNHGEAAAQDVLARRRAQSVYAYLQAHGVAASRIRILARDQADPGGEHLLIRAEGRGW